MKNNYRWFVDVEGLTMSGVVIEEDEEAAKNEVLAYLNECFHDDLENYYLRSEDVVVWTFENDDDYEPSHPGCLAVCY